MASIQDQLKNARTLEDIINLLAILFTNMNNQNNLYYDMFINPEPLYLSLERYDDNGVLTTVPNIPNRAASIISALSGHGSPEGVTTANIGALYIDLDSNDFYYKTESNTSTGWVLVWSSGNFVDGEEYLAPSGNASKLTNLNMDSASSGTLKVNRGGTGTNSITGLIKGNGTAPFSAAVDGADFLGASSMVGMVCYYPTITVPYGWLICNGQEVSTSEYSRLFDVIGYTYGGSGSVFNVPNLIGKYIKCADTDIGQTGAAAVGSHSHPTSSLSIQMSQKHTHGPGTFEISGGVQGAGGQSNQEYSFRTDSNGRRYAVENNKESSASYGAFEVDGKRNKVYNKGAQADNYYSFRASRTWTGRTSEDGAHTHAVTGTISPNSEGVTNEVDHVRMVPIIKW